MRKNNDEWEVAVKRPEEDIYQANFSSGTHFNYTNFLNDSQGSVVAIHLMSGLALSVLLHKILWPPYFWNCAHNFIWETRNSRSVKKGNKKCVSEVVVWWLAVKPALSASAAAVFFVFHPGQSNYQQQRRREK